ncbi:hypothetical protein [Phocaeicola plebeius]|uniref:hypothetical protein n=1 Tax=Phocaeicola plebeius TaxID=310297 RepID=UPI0026F2D5E4|nr:hypothetical protein [Phocaeicola plebeius]
MDYMKSIPDKFFELAIVDPPYGLDKKSTHGRGKLKNRCLNRGNIQRWEIKRIMCELGWKLLGVEIIDINEIHNHLIVEE